MDILHIATHDSGGGAARAAFRLHEGLLRLGHNSRMLVAHRGTNNPSVVQLTLSQEPLDRLKRILSFVQIRRRASRYKAIRPAGFDLFSEDRSELGHDLINQIPPCDVINLHWTTGFLDYLPFFRKVAGRHPIVWTLHDMNVFTGGCHYDDGCQRYTQRCGACPQLGAREQEDLSRRVWNRKKQAFSSIPRNMFKVVADSRWLATEASKSSLLGGFSIDSICYGLDIQSFAPRNGASARVALGIPRESFVVMFAADWVENRRKGLGTLIDAFACMQDTSNLFLISAGNGVVSLPQGIPHLHFGHIESDLLLSVLYSLADVFVIPSLQEAFGQTALESMACGTPVVGSSVGGIREFLQDGINGYLVPPQNPLLLSQAILKLMRDTRTRKLMSANCRDLVVRDYTLEVQARHYLETYASLLRQDKW
jgi:glycosyltransferase involved in cell wall biosynthesis